MPKAVAPETRETASVPAIQNPAMLKLMLGWYGIAGEGEAGSALELVIDSQISARATVNPASPFRLDAKDGDFVIQHGGSSTHVRPTPKPAFSGMRSSHGMRLGDIVQVQGGYAIVTLGGECGLSAPGRACAFCLGRELTQKAGELWPVDDVVDAVRAAFDEGAAEFVGFHLGYFPGDEAGVRILIPYLDAIHHHFDTVVTVKMHPPATTRAIDLTYASGVDALAYNIEAPDEDSMRRNLPGRNRFFGRKRYIEGLQHAAKIFPSGAVWSEIALDLAPANSVITAIDELAAIGVVPLLGITASSSRSELPGGLLDAPACQFSAVLKAGIGMTWARDLSSVITPLEARYFVPDAPHLPVLIQQLTRNRLGALTARSLARLRRRLRVKRVRASFDSSHL